MAEGAGLGHREDAQEDTWAGRLSIERRGHQRYTLWFPVQIDGDELGVAVGVATDVSVKGLSIDAQAGFVIGAPVRLTFRVGGDLPLLELDATIVRCTRTRGVWPYRLAVELDDPMPQLECATAV
jgi:hypothetical protein